MNKKEYFRIGAKVVLREEDELGVAVKHLFEVEEFVRGSVDSLLLKSTSTGFKIVRSKKEIRFATDKEKYMTEGNSVIIDGEGYLISGESLVGTESGYLISQFSSNMIFGDNTKVSVIFRNPSACFVDKVSLEHTLSNVLWRRPLEPFTLSSDEEVVLKYVGNDIVGLARDEKGFLMAVDSKGERFRNYFGETLFQFITYEVGVVMIKELLME